LRHFLEAHTGYLQHQNDFTLAGRQLFEHLQELACVDLRLSGLTKILGNLGKTDLSCRNPPSPAVRV